MALSAKNEIVAPIRFSLLLAEVFLAVSSVQVERIRPVLTKLQNKVVLAMENFLEITFLFKLLFCLSFCLKLKLNTSRCFSLFLLLQLLTLTFVKTLCHSWIFEFMLPDSLQESVILKTILTRPVPFEKQKNPK